MGLFLRPAGSVYMTDSNHQFSQENAQEIAGSDRRQATRYTCNVSATGHILGPRGGASWVATITNISATGIGLIHRAKVKPGTVFVIKLQSGNQKLSRPLPVRVMHASPIGNEEWLLGCAFVRKINEEDLQSLI